MNKILLIFMLFTMSHSLYAIDKNPTEFDNPEQEQRYQALVNELRCVVCQNQSVGDSNAELAQDVRELVHKKIRAGESDQQIKDFMVERYGEFVLYNPPLNTKSYVLWYGPLALLLLAFIMLVYFIRRHAKTTAAPPSLTDEERLKLNEVLKK
jgi:cytochrome c-type biogenesis protein CcmH